jgi:hypothetical protein
MKTTSFYRIITAGILSIVLLLSIHAYSQQRITFTNGSTLKVVITSQTKDSVMYYKPGEPKVIYGETTNRILKIETLGPIKDYKPTSNAPLMTDDKEYWKYKRGATVGGVVMGTGAIIGIAGLIGWGNSHDASNADQTLGAVFSVIGMVAGTGLFVAGGIVLAVNSVNLSVYNKEHNLSLNLKCTPQVTGISLVYTLGGKQQR